MTSRRPSSPRTRRFLLQVEPPAGIEPATPSLPFVLSRSYRGVGAGQGDPVTVNDRQAPPESAPYGTQMARRPVTPNEIPHGGGQQRPTL
jgi:hypothetical protein